MGPCALVDTRRTFETRTLEVLGEARAVCGGGGVMKAHSLNFCQRKPLMHSSAVWGSSRLTIWGSPPVKSLRANVIAPLTRFW